MCKIAKYDLSPIQIGRHQNVIYVVSEFPLNLVFITKTIYFDVPLAYVFGVVFGHMNANTDADGQLQTNVGDVVTIRRVEDVVIGNKGILLEIRESKGNERSGAPGRRRILTWKKRCLRGGGSGPDRDGTTAAPADKEN